MSWHSAKKIEKRLLNVPTAQWKKDDWVVAAKILSSMLRPISPAAKEKDRNFRRQLKNKIISHGSQRNTEKGRPEESTASDAKELLQGLMDRKPALAEKLNKPEEKVTDKDHALELAIEDEGENDGESVSQRAKRYQRRIKYAKNKVKTG